MHDAQRVSGDSASQAATVSPSTVLACLGLIVVLYIAQQTIGLSWRWVDDETWFLIPAKALLEEGRLRIPVFSGPDREFWMYPPLLPVIQAVSWSLHEMSAVQALALMALFGIGAVVATFSLGRRLFDEARGVDSGV